MARFWAGDADRIKPYEGVEQQPRILILSDDPIRAEVVRAALTGIGAEIVVASGGEALRRMTERAVYALVILLDTRYLFSGEPLFRRIRPRPLRRPELFVLSWQLAEQTVLGMLECGVDQYMTFPLNLVRLRAKVIGALMR